MFSTAVLFHSSLQDQDDGDDDDNDSEFSNPSTGVGMMHGLMHCNYYNTIFCDYFL